MSKPDSRLTFVRVPWLHVKAITIIPFCFHVGEKLSEQDKNHERIHAVQCRELGWVRFYVSYLRELVVGAATNGWDWWASYYAISYEREAYQHDGDLQYLDARPPLAHEAYRDSA